MKRYIFSLAALVAVALGTKSCDSSTIGTSSVSSIGSAYELLVVCGQDKWEGELGDTLRNILGAPVDHINNIEPSFDLLRIFPNSLSDMLRRTRMILNVVTGPEYAEPKISADFDVYASPQIFASITGPDQHTLAEYISRHRMEFRDLFELAERQWAINHAKRYNESEIQRIIKERFGFDMFIPRGYVISDNTHEDFIRLQYNYRTAIQGIMIYEYPYVRVEDFMAEALLAQRNFFAGRVPGGNDGSHMTTFSTEDYAPEVQYYRIGNRNWAEMRGFWDMAGDYMGGPFVSYSTIDAERDMVVTLDFYVFSPDKPKRNYLRGLEHLIYTVDFPGDSTKE